MTIIKLLGTREQKENKAVNTGTEAVFLIFQGTGNREHQNRKIVVGNTRNILLGTEEQGIPLGERQYMDAYMR